MRNGHKSSLLCPCVDCKNEKQYSNQLSVHAHLILRGFIDDYRCWNKHGEEGVNEQDGEEGLHKTCAGGNEEAPFGNEELCDDDVAEIAASPVPMVENLEEMVRDAFGFDEYTGAESKKLKQLMEDMKTPLYSSCNERYMKCPLH